MLIPREEMKFDFKGAQFDLQRPEERKLLAWVFNQFLYGEVTGIQCGHWLYRAPTLSAATFLAKQAGEELSHVRKFLRLFSLLGEKPGPAHPAVKFLSTGMMGGSWGEHVAMEMALGEGLVLSVFYALAETTQSHREIHKILESATGEEEGHVTFGERETIAWIKEYPESRRHLLGLAMVQVLALSHLKSFVSRKLIKQVGAEHPVFRQFDAFYDHTLKNFGRRIELLGLSAKPLNQMGVIEKFALVASLPFYALRGFLSGRPPLLTSTYLSDPALREEESRRQSRLS